MYTTGGERSLYTSTVPGTPIPRAGTESRVVADGQSPITISNIARLASRGCPAFQPTASLLPASYIATPDPSTCVYVPYRHVHTGERALVALRRDATTGVRMPVVPPPSGFLPAPVNGADESPNFLQWLAGLLCRHPDEPSVDPHAVLATAPHPPTRQRFSPVDIRQPMFDEDTNDDGMLQSPAAMMLSTKTLSSLKTKLELPKINDFIIDLKAACGRRDEAAHLLLTSPDWHALLAGGHPLLVQSNKRIAAYIDACLDTEAPSVILFKSKLREADSTDRPGILFSGMDILEEIAALVTERSLGEFKLNSIVAKPILKAGATIDETRITMDTIKKNFTLKIDSERAVPNALFHDVLGYMPDSDPTLKLKKEEYESKLYKAEMHKISPPWTLTELIDEIAVDLARASPAKEVSSAFRPSDRPPAELTPIYRCASCGATGQHLSKDCPKKCSKCNFNFCPGNRGMLCAVECLEQPSTRSLKNFFDRDLHSYLVTKLDKAWAAKHEKQLSMAELLEVAAVEEDEEEEESLNHGLINPGN